MSVTVRFESREWDNFIRHIDEKVKEPTKLLRSVMFTWGFKDLDEHFRNEQGPDGRWQPRKESTNRAYDQLGGKYRSSNKILQLSGDLRKSVLPGGAQVSDKGRYAIAVVSDPDYGGRHNEGSRGMPKREFMWLSDNAVDRMAETILTLVTGN